MVDKITKVMENNKAANLAACLTSQKFTVPNLYRFYPGWPVGINPLYKHMIPVVDEKLDRYIRNPHKPGIGCAK